jgi:ribosomal protein S18 acetylase RimI-like enzyme
MITLRNATTSDVGMLQNLNDEVFVDNCKYDTDLDMNWAKGTAGFAYFTQLVENKDAFCIIAEDEGRVPIGYLAASPHPISYRKSRYIELENMGVIPTYRSKGVGSLLMAEFSKWAKKHSFDKILVNAYSANTGAVEFYKRNGFEVIDVTLEKSVK